MSELVTLPNGLLRQKAEPVQEIDAGVRSLAEEMVQFIQLHQADQPRPVALAAPQLGKPVRMIAFRQNLSAEDIQVLINPELVYRKGSRLVYESCLSIPGKQFTVRRAKIVKIRGLTLDNVERSFRAGELLAQVFEHEIDHLNGILVDQVGREVKK